MKCDIGKKLQTDLWVHSNNLADSAGSPAYVKPEICHLLLLPFPNGWNYFLLVLKWECFVCLSIIFRYIYYYYVMCINVLPSCVYVHHPYVLHPERSKLLIKTSLLGLELQMAVSHHTGNGNLTPVLWKNKCSYY